MGRSHTRPEREEEGGGMARLYLCSQRNNEAVGVANGENAATAIQGPVFSSTGVLLSRGPAASAMAQRRNRDS